jgi:glycosyltransferase involved in cell wall biosynthesis
VRLPWSLGTDLNFNGNHSHNSALPAGFPNGKVILTVGRWDANEAYKGADHLIEIMPELLERFSDVHLVAVGSGTDVPRLKSIAKGRGVSERVHFLSSITNEELSAAYEACDLFALPSRGEGFGLVFLEAMSHAKPVIGGAHGGTTDIIDDGADGYVVEYANLRNLIEKTTQLLRDDVLRAEMGRRGYTKVRNEYTFDRFRSKLEGTLDTLLGTAQKKSTE